MKNLILNPAIIITFLLFVSVGTMQAFGEEQIPDNRFPSEISYEQITNHSFGSPIAPLFGPPPGGGGDIDTGDGGGTTDPGGSINDAPVGGGLLALLCCAGIHAALIMLRRKKRKVQNSSI
jgi:hypothetical protein